MWTGRISWPVLSKFTQPLMGGSPVIWQTSYPQRGEDQVKSLKHCSESPIFIFSSCRRSFVFSPQQLGNHSLPPLHHQLQQPAKPSCRVLWRVCEWHRSMSDQGLKVKKVDPGVNLVQWKLTLCIVSQRKQSVRMKIKAVVMTVKRTRNRCVAL